MLPAHEQADDTADGVLLDSYDYNSIFFKQIRLMTFFFQKIDKIQHQWVQRDSKTKVTKNKEIIASELERVIAQRIFVIIKTHNFVSRQRLVQDFDEEKIFINGAESKLEEQRGTVHLIYMDDKTGEWCFFETVFLSNRKDFMMFSFPTLIGKTQRREHFRVTAGIKSEISFQYEDIRIHGFLIDISFGGAWVKLNKKENVSIKQGDLIKSIILTLFLRDGHKWPDIDVSEGEIIRIKKEKQGKDMITFLAIRFLHQTGKLFLLERYIFEQERIIKQVPV